MSNTVRRPRKRPRVRSCSFRTLGWLIRKQASWRVVYGLQEPMNAPRTAQWWCSIDNEATDHAAELVIRGHTYRRIYP